MSATQFIASLVRSLAWPVAVVVLVWLLRQQLKTLLSGPLSRLKAGPSGLELEWDRTAAKVREDVEQTKHPKREPGALASMGDQPLDEWAETAPSAVILEAYESAMRRLAEAAGVSREPGEISQEILIQTAVEHGAITPKNASTWRGLRILRDLALARPDRVTADEAREYVTWCAALAYGIRKPDADEQP